jgi:very-short-patch-repair endonuclease
MNALTREALAWAAGHHNTMSTIVLRSCGVTRAQQRKLITEGILERISDGVYRFTGASADELSLCSAACSHPIGLVVAGPTAGRLWGLRRLPKDDLVHVIAPPATNPISAPWLAPYRTSMLDPGDIVYRDDGIALTSPPRTAVDLCRWLSVDDLRSVIDQIEHEHKGSAATMRRVATMLDTPGRPWARRFLDVLDDRAAGRAPESHGESRVLAALRARGLVDVEPQRWLDLPGWGRIRLDAAVDRIRWGIEIDGHGDHFTELGAARDRDRDLICDAIGWRVSRIATVSLQRAFRTSIDRLMAVYYRRCLEFSGDAA